MEPPDKRFATPARLLCYARWCRLKREAATAKSGKIRQNGYR